MVIARTILQVNRAALKTMVAWFRLHAGIAPRGFTLPARTAEARYNALV